jgi:hypothetical protein
MRLNGGALMVGIQAMFAEYSGEDVDWFQLTFWFERQREIRLEAQREAQRMIDWRKRGGPPGRRGRPKRYSADEIKERRKKQNLAAWHRWNEKQKGRAA